MAKKFTRTIENFNCEHCGNTVVGDGYTNHCPKCLWSKHVDVNPGDREELCGGLMKPISGVTMGGRQSVFHFCVVCGFTRKNSLSSKDNFDVFYNLSGKSFDTISSSRKFR